MMSVIKSPFWRAFGLISGMVIGSGMFALPYAVSVSGFLASIVAGAVAFFAVLSIHLAYGEIAVNTEERHRLPGYIKLYLGNFFGNINKFSEIIFFNATLLIYGLLGGVFLLTIFGGTAFWWTLVFFAVSALILFFEKIEQIGFLNFMLTIPLIAAVLLISGLAFSKSGAGNITMQVSDPFFVFGFLMFALTGLSAIPDAYDIFRFNGVVEKDPLKKAITFGTAMPIILYTIFIVGVLSVANGIVSEDAISSLEIILGRPVVILGAIAGFLAVFTSFLVLAYDLRQIYRLDIGVSKIIAWFLSALVPSALFLFGLTDFMRLISIVGGVFIALDGFFVIFILRKLRKINPTSHKFLQFGRFQQTLLILIFTASIIYELVYQIL